MLPQSGLERAAAASVDRHDAAMGSNEVLEFWFGRDAKSWFSKDPLFDAEIRSRFLTLYERAVAGELESWKRASRSCLALVIVLDQFPRNMFRGDARAFAGDERAREAALTILERGWDRGYTPAERDFAYLPFEHSESLADQERSLRLFSGGENAEWARKHYDIVRRFGRFPHRNAALGRESTAAEMEFLKQPGSSF